MDHKKAKRLQRKVLKQTQQRLNRLLGLLMRSHLSKRANADTNDALEDLLSRSVANSMFTNGFSVGPFGITSPATASALSETTPISTMTSESPTETLESDVTDICNDIRGRDRACCNSASRCFNDVKGVVDELENAAPGSFSLMSACRKVNSELKRDKICVQRSLSRCGGPDRVLLQRRFNNRVDTLYDQFYKHCSKDPSRTTTRPTPSPTKETPIATDVGISLPAGVTSKPVTSTSHGGVHIPLSKIPGWEKPGDFSPITPHDHSTHDHNRNIVYDSNTSSGSGAVLAGAITGGIVLMLVLIVGLVFWCKSRRAKNGSNGSMDSAGIFFQKRPNMFSTERPRGENNNKHPLHRQESAIYAEIDEAMVNPGYKPPVPGNMPHCSYLSPIGDEDSYTPPPGNHGVVVPVATTRGQLSYGPILAANGASESQNKNLFYHSTSVTDPMIHDHEAFLTQKNLQSGTGNESSDSAYVTADSLDASNDSLDDYEEPISTNSSLRYTHLDQLSPPGHQAPEVPAATEKISESPPKNEVSVLPSNPFVPFTDTKKPDDKPVETGQPIAKPRRKNDVTNNNIPQSDVATSGKMADKEIIKRADVMGGSRDSTLSDSSAKSSHHYFVLEPDHTKMDYENAVSTPKLV